MALARLGRTDDLATANRRAVENGVWASVWQRPSVSVRDHSEPPLRAQPWWDVNDLPSELRRAIVSLRKQLPAVVVEGVSSALTRAVMLASALHQNTPLQRCVCFSDFSLCIWPLSKSH